MQVHTFIAESANEAVSQIREQLGPAAVVLSVRKLPRNGVSRFLRSEQIEVVAGIEEQPVEPAKPAFQTVDPIAELRAEIRELKRHLTSPSPAALGQTARTLPHAATVSPRSNEIQDRRVDGTMVQLLTRTGLMPLFAEQICAEISGAGGDKLALPAQIEMASAILRRHWRGEIAPAEAGVHVFVGVPASGKSTVLCKMLAQASLVEAQPAAIYQLDTDVTNASPQPGVYAEVLGADFQRTAPLEFERREQSVFVDLPGVALGNERGLKQLEQLIAEFGVPEVHLALNAAYETSHLLEQVRFFSSLGISDLVVTHLDEEPRWGKLWNLILATDCSVRFLSSGQNIPGDFFPATAEAVLKRQFSAN